MITVKRDTGIVGSAMKMGVYINDEKVAALGNKEVREFQIGSEEVTLKVGFAYLHSNPLTVKDGQTVIAKGSLVGSFLWIFGLKSSYLVIEG